MHDWIQLFGMKHSVLVSRLSEDETIATTQLRHRLNLSCQLGHRGYPEVAHPHLELHPLNMHCSLSIFLYSNSVVTAQLRSSRHSIKVTETQLRNSGI